MQNNNLELMEKNRMRQTVLVENAQVIIKNWFKKNFIKISKHTYCPHFGLSLDVYIFYETNSDLELYKTNGVSSDIKQKFLNILEDLGYMKEFNDNIRFEFDSDENVKKNYKGNYYWRLL